VKGRPRLGALLAAVVMCVACGGEGASTRGSSSSSGGMGDMAGMDHSMSHPVVPADWQPLITPPDPLLEGKRLFEAKCAGCHGPWAAGTDHAPPLVHPYYLPSHHADEAFQRAVLVGVRPHHWSFGPMPPIPGLTRDQVAEVVGYVRWLQRTAQIE
jgi:mono/diheme cytochrome c family protein